VAISDAPMLVPERVIAHPIHTAKHQPFLPVDTNAPTELSAQESKAGDPLPGAVSRALVYRRIRGPVGAVANWLHFALGLLFFSPVALMFQALPEKEERLKVVAT
jgi:hypothetical protein